MSLLHVDKESHIDYMEKSKYFEDPQKELEDLSNDQLTNAKKFVIWAQSFSKKIIIGISLLYFAITLFVLIIVAIQTFTGSAPTVDSIYQEMNVTFRIIVAGYLVKAGVENSFKIAGNYKVGMKDAELRAQEFIADNNDEEPSCEVPEDEVVLNEEDTTI